MQCFTCPSRIRRHAVFAVPATNHRLQSPDRDRLLPCRQCVAFAPAGSAGHQCTTREGHAVLYCHRRRGGNGWAASTIGYVALSQHRTLEELLPQPGSAAAHCFAQRGCPGEGGPSASDSGTGGYTRSRQTDPYSRQRPPGREQTAGKGRLQIRDACVRRTAGQGRGHNRRGSGRTVPAKRVATLDLPHEGEGDLDKPGTLYILAIGVDKYPNLPGKDLRYARRRRQGVRPGDGEARKPLAPPGDQARAGQWWAGRGCAYCRQHSGRLQDAWQTKENDTVMLFVAGHGVNEGRDYQFAPTMRSGAATRSCSSRVSCRGMPSLRR